MVRETQDLSNKGAYGEALASRFRLDKGPAFVARTLSRQTLAVTEIRCESENNGLSEAIPRENTLLVTLQLRDCPAHDLWIDGKATKTAPLAAGETTFYDLRASPVVNSVSAFHNLHFYLPYRALDAMAEAEGLAPLHGPPGRANQGRDDHVIRGLGLALRPAFERPAEANLLFVDHVTTAVAAHVTRIAAETWKSEPLILTQAQVERLREAIRADLSGSLRVSDLARDSGLPPSRLLSAFREATGTSAHRWLLQCRVDRAHELLLRSRLPMDELAAACGFAGEAHLVRVFLKLTGVHPAALRSGS
jgi:AraC-like DNA-binding protein